MKKEKGIGLIKLLFIIVLIIIIIGVIIFIANFKDGHKLTTEEKAVYLNFRNSISQGISSGESNPEKRVSNLSQKDYDIIGEMVKDEDSSNLWLLNEEQGWIVGAYDTYDMLIERGYSVEQTKEYEITYLYDGEYLSVLYVRHTGNDYYLFDYEFKSCTTLPPNSVFFNMN